MYGLECGVRQGGLTSPRLFNLYINGLLAGKKVYTNVPPLHLGGTALRRVERCKYLGHWVSDNLSDDEDLERERRALAVRCNMLARKFACLWVKYTQRAYSALRVQYNNAFRVLFGLPRYCSASEMFAERRVDSFYAIIRKRSASALQWLRTSSNGILCALADRWDSEILRHWIRLHAV
ncbi:uncharacterized protein LOC113398707 [Vanessa tameamea]|uniref:Uncharacterized protein LOC113398707 n=1 Tax=Vanessa tameamea TaxID=334116 RepID=A0ABM4ARD8_VANTA